MPDVQQLRHRWINGHLVIPLRALEHDGIDARQLAEREIFERILVWNRNLVRLSATADPLANKPEKHDNLAIVERAISVLNCTSVDVRRSIQRRNDPHDLGFLLVLLDAQANGIAVAVAADGDDDVVVPDAVRRIVIQHGQRIAADVREVDDVRFARNVEIRDGERRLVIDINHATAEQAERLGPDAEEGVQRAAKREHAGEAVVVDDPGDLIEVNAVVTLRSVTPLDNANLEGRILRIVTHIREIEANRAANAPASINADRIDAENLGHAGDIEMHLGGEAHFKLVGAIHDVVTEVEAVQQTRLERTDAIRIEEQAARGEANLDVREEADAAADLRLDARLGDERDAEAEERDGRRLELPLDFHLRRLPRDEFHVRVFQQQLDDRAGDWRLRGEELGDRLAENANTEAVIGVTITVQIVQETAAAGDVTARGAARPGVRRRNFPGNVTGEIEIFARVDDEPEPLYDIEYLEEQLDPRLSGEIAEEFCRGLVDERELGIDDADDLGRQRIELVDLLQERPDELAQELAQLELDAGEARRRIGRTVDRAEAERAGRAGIPIGAEGRLHAGAVLAQLDAHRHDDGRRSAGVETA